MIKWLRKLLKVRNYEKEITQLQNKCDNLVDRLNQLEQTVQSLSDENQLLIQTVYSKKGE